LLALGALGAVAATVSGLVVHLAYDNDPVLASAIEVHQYTAFAATAVFAALAAWRWLSLPRGSDVGGIRTYFVLALLGLPMLGVAGLLGGNLRTALLAWLFARSRRARFLARFDPARLPREPTIFIPEPVA
jgi:hypothetical protein